MDNSTPSRRSFLKYIGVGTGISAIGVSGVVALKNVQPPKPSWLTHPDTVASAEAALPVAPVHLDGRLGDLSHMAQAIAQGTLRITLLGDSILEGISQITYQDSPAGLWMRTLQEQNPTLNIIFSNYSIPGQGTYQARHPNFVGAADNVPGVSFNMAESSQAERRWPGGTVIGKSWWDHVADSTPDLLVIGFGMNHVVQGDWAYNPTTVENAVFYHELQYKMAFWPKVPSVALITSMLPTTRTDIDDGVWPRLRVMVQQDADMHRGICRELDWTCIDANRWWSLLADGRDPVLMGHEYFPLLNDYASSWPATSGAWTVTGDDSLGGSGTLRSKEMCSDLYQRMNFTVSSLVDSTPGMFWRDRGDQVQGQPNRYSVSLVQDAAGAAQLQVSWQDKSLALMPLGAAKSSYLLELLVEGARHRVYVDNTLVADLSHMGNMGEGYNGVFLTGAVGTMSNSAVRQGRPAVVGEAKYSQKELLGVDDWLSNWTSLGGGARNHPSKLGVQVAYVPAFAPLTRAINQFAVAGGGVVTRTVRDDTTDFWTGLTGAALVIDGQIQGAVAPMTSGKALMLIASATAKVEVAANREVPVLLGRNDGREELATTLALGPGRWTIAATAQLSRLGATAPASDLHVQTLTVTAVRV